MSTLRRIRSGPSRTRLNRIASVFVATSALLLGSAPVAAASAPAVSTEAAAAADWLASQFVGTDHTPSPAGTHLEGSYGSPPTYYFDGGRTADAVYALAAAKADKAKLSAVLDYFAEHLGEYTNITDTSGRPGPSDGQIAKAALAAIVTGADPTSFGGHDLLKALKDDACTAVSAPADQKDVSTPTCPAVGSARNSYSSISQSLVIVAAARGAGAHGATYAPSSAAVDYFLSLQCPEGGFTGKTTACTKDADATVDATAYAAFALQSLGGHEQQWGRALDYLQTQRDPAGYWIAEGGPDVDSTGLASAALAAGGRDVTASRSWLVTQQVTDGPQPDRGALKYQGRFDALASVKATADGLLGMVPDGSLATVTLAAPPAPSPTADDSGGDGPSTAAVLAGVLGGAALLIGLVALAYSRRRQQA